MMATARARIDVCRDDRKLLETLREDVRRGLGTRPRSLPPKYFYDAKGTRLFRKITRLPEYYLTRAEMALLADRAEEIARWNGSAELVELGPGGPRKSRLLLQAMAEAGRLRRYVPVDISAEALTAIAAEIPLDFPDLEIYGIAGDFEEALDRIPPGGPRLVAFLGSTIGNLDRPPAVALIRRIGRLLKREDLFLLGTDMVKEVPVLEAAYNDAAGVTAAFNRNILAVVNRLLKADFILRRFDHLAFFNTRESRVEMHLRARKAHTVRIRDLKMTVPLEAGETIHTENSAKYTRESVEAILKEAGLELRAWLAGVDGAFALSLSGRSS